ncbi:MAG: glutathione S-transferase family protein [Pseudomonadota bacterium]|nr:glutathione S-transferase family protein [Pseudomonadota bacterium]
MKLYSFQPSPYGSRVRLALRHKRLDFEVASPPEVDPETSHFLASSPMEVPTLVADDGTAVSGSTAILDYLEDAFPEPSLLPHAPEARGRARMLAQTPDSYIHDAPRKLFGMANPAQRDVAAIDEAFGMITTALVFVDTRIDGGGWAVGEKVSIADCALIPVLNAVALLGAIHGRPNVIAEHAKLGAYWAAAQRDPINAALIAEQLAGLPAPLQGFAPKSVGANS